MPWGDHRLHERCGDSKPLFSSGRNSASLTMLQGREDARYECFSLYCCKHISVLSSFVPMSKAKRVAAMFASRSTWRQATWQNGGEGAGVPHTARQDNTLQSAAITPVSHMVTTAFSHTLLTATPECTCISHQIFSFRVSAGVSFPECLFSCHLRYMYIILIQENQSDRPSLNGAAPLKVGTDDDHMVSHTVAALSTGIYQCACCQSSFKACSLPPEARTQQSSSQDKCSSTLVSNLSGSHL